MKGWNFSELLFMRRKVFSEKKRLQHPGTCQVLTGLKKYPNKSTNVNVCGIEQTMSTEILGLFLLLEC